MRLWPHVLGLLTGLSAATAATAGELGRVPDIEPLRMCSPGETAIAGSATCIRFGGVLRAETSVRSGLLRPGSGGSGRRDTTSTRVTGRLTVDVRIPTDHGPLRAYASIRAGAPRFGEGGGQ